MKLLLSLLVVGNLLALAWMQGWLGPLTADGRDPARLARQINPDLLTIEPPDSAGAAAGRPSTPAPVGAPTTSPPGTIAPPVDAPAGKAVSTPTVPSMGAAAVAPGAAAVAPRPAAVAPGAASQVPAAPAGASGPPPTAPGPPIAGPAASAVTGPAGPANVTIGAAASGQSGATVPAGVIGTYPAGAPGSASASNGKPPLQTPNGGAALVDPGSANSPVLAPRVANGSVPGVAGPGGAGSSGVGDPGGDPALDRVAWSDRLRAAACIEFGPQDEGTTLRLQAAIDASFPGLPMEIRRAEEPTSFWVYLPPASNPAEGQRRVAEVRELGVTDVFLVPDGPFRGAISLGVYRQEALAHARQRTLADLGIRSPRVAPRSAGTRSSLKVPSVPPSLPAELAKLQASFPDATARDCPGSMAHDTAAR